MGCPPLPRSTRTIKLETIAQADDIQDANGADILDFWQAQEAARNLRSIPASKVGGYTVADAAAVYLESLEGKASYTDVSKRIAAYVLPALGDRPVNELRPQRYGSGTALLPRPRRDGAHGQGQGADVTAPPT